VLVAHAADGRQAANLDPPVQPLYAHHLLACLLVNDLNNARFLWKRVPAELKKVGASPLESHLNAQEHGELTAMWKIGQSLWDRNYDQVCYLVGCLLGLLPPLICV
jgi:hypothetical protein